MDDTTRLASELLHKLAELDQKVNEYRQDMAQEFQRYSRHLLKDVPKDVSTKVEKVIAGELQNYPALNHPVLDQPVDSHPSDDANTTTSTNTTSHPDHKGRSGQRSPLPVLQHTTDVPQGDGTRSPHDREREFYGLFTPSYLPLLDAVQRPNLAPTQSPQPPQAPEVKESNENQDTLPTSLDKAVASRPNHTRTHTEETISSNTSDDSATRFMRSALRRSSNSPNKIASPRRVRFDVEGQEVLPTASPPISPRASDIPPSPLGNTNSSLNESCNSIFLDEATDLLGSSPPRPKKITSTERLRSMARNSTEDTSKWTVVGSPNSEDDEEDDLVMSGMNGTSQAATNNSDLDGAAHHINDARLPTQTGPALPVVHESEEEEQATEEDDEDMVKMTPLSSFKDKKRFSPPQETASSATDSEAPETQRPHNNQTPAAKPSNIRKTNTFHIEDDDEDMFEFEGIGGSASNGSGEGDKSRSGAKYIEEDEGETTPTAEAPKAVPQSSLYSTSPALPIAKLPPPPPAPSRFMAASTGSYKGKPFSIEPVRDKDVHKKAAEMGDFQSFVGSVDGRSGVDESTSYRPDMAQFDGTPRSLSERMMKEDMEELRRNTESNK